MPVGLPDFPPVAALSALAPRLASSSRAALDNAFDARTLVRLRAMRGAPVVVPVGDYDLFASGMLPRDEPSMRAFVGAAMDSVKRAKLPAEEAVDLVTRRASEALSAKPLDRDALHARLRATLPDPLLPYCRACESHHVHPSLLYAVALKGRLVLFPQSDGPYLVWRFDRWMAAAKNGRKQLPGAAANDHAANLLRRFLAAYGPATPAEFAGWAGIGGGQPQAVWSRVTDELVAVELGAPGQRTSTRFVLAGDADELRAADEASEPAVRLLAPGDPLLQLRDRDTLVQDTALQKVIWKNLSPSGVVLVGPQVAAIARLQKKRTRLEVTIESIRRFDRVLRAAVEEAAERLSEVRGCSDVAVAWS